MTQARVNLSGILGVLLLIPLVGCPGNGEPVTETPKEAFLASLARIEARDFESEWRHMSPALQQEWGRGIDELKRKVRADSGNRPAFDTMLEQQYELKTDEFLKTDPRVLHARYLEVNRQRLLRYQILGEARVEGDIAYLPVRLLKDEDPIEFRYVRIDGRWLLDEGTRSR